MAPCSTESANLGVDVEGAYFRSNCRGFWFVTDWAAPTTLPLRALVGPKEKLDVRGTAKTTQLVVRGCGMLDADQLFRVGCYREGPPRLADGIQLPHPQAPAEPKTR